QVKWDQRCLWKRSSCHRSDFLLAKVGLSEYVVVSSGPLCEGRCVLDGWLAKHGIAHAQHTELGRHAANIGADAIKICIRRALRQGRSNSVLGSRILRYRLFQRIQQDGINVRQLPEG